MGSTKNGILKNSHLIVSILIVVPTAIIYGSPLLLPEYLDIQVNSTDLSNLLKAIMFLYLGISLVWLLGIWKSEYWKSATHLNIIFMLSLGTGRFLSLLTDGLPTGGYIFAVLMEFVLGFFAIYQLKKYNPERLVLNKKLPKIKKACNE